jgi:hypothetical protein
MRRGPPAAISAQAARRQVSDQLQAWGLQHLTDDAELIISEPATNAACHGNGRGSGLAHGTPHPHRGRRNGPARSRRRRQRRAREGGGPVQRESGTPGAIEEDLPCNGRDLFLAEALSSDLGVWRLPHGHVAWATLPTWPESAADMQCSRPGSSALS